MAPRHLSLLAGAVLLAIAGCGGGASVPARTGQSTGALAAVTSCISGNNECHGGELGPEACSRTQGYWKNHECRWSDFVLTISNASCVREYQQDNANGGQGLICLMNKNDQGGSADASTILIKQLVAALLNKEVNGANVNIASGLGSLTVLEVINEARERLAEGVCHGPITPCGEGTGGCSAGACANLPYGWSPSQCGRTIALAAALDDFNNGRLGGSFHCDECPCQECTTDEQCADSHACTTDACVDGHCVNTASNAACTAGAACQTAACNPASPDADEGGCVYTPNDALCTGGTPCTAAACNPASSSADASGCVYTPVTDTPACQAECEVDGDCHDAWACTANACVSGQCVYTPNDALCTGGATCTTATCNPLSSAADASGCVYAPVTDTPGCQPPECTSAAQCDDQDGCTTDSCEGGTCVHTPIDCGDEDGCTTDSCQAGACKHVRDNPVCECPEAQAIDLGPAKGWNVFVCGSYAGALDIAGKAAVAGTVDFEGFSVGAADPGGLALVSGGDLKLTSGTVYGSAAHGGKAEVSPTVTFAGGHLSQGTPIDFGAACASLRAISDQAAGAATNGVASLSGCTLTLTGTKPSNVFSVSGDTLAGVCQYVLDIPADATALVNVTGTGAVAFQNAGTQDLESKRGRILWNAPHASTVTITGISFQGSLLAPRSTLYLADGSNVDGQVIAAGVVGGGELHRFGLVQAIVVSPCPDAAPTRACTFSAAVSSWGCSPAAEPWAGSQVALSVRFTSSDGLPLAGWSLQAKPSGMSSLWGAWSNGYGGWVSAGAASWAGSGLGAGSTVAGFGFNGSGCAKGPYEVTLTPAGGSPIACAQE